MKPLAKKIATYTISAAAAFTNIDALSQNHDHNTMHAPTNGAHILHQNPIKDSSLSRLTDHNGQIISDTDFEGKNRAIFFGFTHCPSVCPTGMATISQAIRNIEKKHGQTALDNTTFILVSTDPERDSPARMKEWLSYFNPRIIGLTGDENLLKEKAQNYRADRMGHHSPYLYLIDKEGKFLSLVNTQTTVTNVQNAIESALITPRNTIEHHHEHEM